MDLTTLVQEQLAEQHVCSRFIDLLTTEAVLLAATDRIAELANEQVALASAIALIHHAGLANISAMARAQLEANPLVHKFAEAVGRTDLIDMHIRNMERFLEKYCPTHKGKCEHERQPREPREPGAPHA